MRRIPTRRRRPPARGQIRTARGPQARRRKATASPASRTGSTILLVRIGKPDYGGDDSAERSRKARSARPSASQRPDRPTIAAASHMRKARRKSGSATDAPPSHPLRSPVKENQKSVDNRGGVGWTAGQIEVDRKNAFKAGPASIISAGNSSRDGASADRHHPARLGHGVVSRPQRLEHWRG